MSRKVSSVLHVHIREELQRREWTSTQLAERLGVQLGVVSRWLSEDPEKRVVPLPPTLVQIAEVLDWDAVEVFKQAGFLPRMDDQPTSPRENEIRVVTRRVRRMLQAVQDPDWQLAYSVAQAHVDGLQLVLNRLDSRNGTD